MSLTDLAWRYLGIVVVAFALGGWLLYFRERERSRDYLHELSQLVHDYELNRDDLRRSLKHSEADQMVAYHNDRNTEARDVE